MQGFPTIFPVLETPELNLIELKDEHAADLFRLFTDQRVTAFYHVVPLREEKDTKKVIDWFHQRFLAKSTIRWGITLRGQNNLIGTIGFNSFTQTHRGTIVYALAYDYWGQGYISAAIRRIAAFGFQDLHLNRVEAEVLPGNIASEKVLGKNGFRHEGLLRQWILWEDRFYDVNMWSLLRDQANW